MSNRNNDDQYDALAFIDDALIGEATEKPAGRRSPLPYLAAVAAAAVLVFAAFAVFGREKPAGPEKQAQATPAPIITEAPGEAKHSSNVKIVSTGAASTGEEWDRLEIRPGKERDFDIMLFDIDDPEPRTPEQLLLDPRLTVFRGTVTKVENYTLIFGDLVHDSPETFVSVVTFSVTECYRGSLAAGSETRVFVDGSIGGDSQIMPPIGAPGSGPAYYTRLRPGTEAIMIVTERSGDEGFFMALNDSETDTYLMCFFCYNDIADCSLGWVSSGCIFFESDGRFYYDVDVYNESMLGKDPSMDSAERFIRSMISGAGI